MMKTETESKQRRSENNHIVITIPLAICQANKELFGSKALLLVFFVTAEILVCFSDYRRHDGERLRLTFSC